MKALTALPVCLAFALLGVVKSDFTFFCTADAGETCSVEDQTVFDDIINGIYADSTFVLTSIGDEERLFTPMNTFPASSPQGIRANMIAQAALKRARKKNAAATGIEPLQSFEGDGFTITSPNVEYFVDYFAQKFAVDTALSGEVDEVEVGEVDEVEVGEVDEVEVGEVDEVAVDTTDGRMLNTIACCYCHMCDCCDLSGCGSSCRRRRALPTVDMEELSGLLTDAIDFAIKEEKMSCVSSSDQCGILS